jgi:PAS domain S-box-containing protein
MPSKAKSSLTVENAALRARRAGPEDPLVNRPSRKRGGLPESGITERKRIEAALKASETRYRRLFETAKDGILILDADTGAITDVNPFLQNLLGYSYAELLGKRLWEIGPFRDIAASRNAFRKLQKKKYIRYEDLPLETKGHRRRHVEFVSNVYRENGARVIQCNIRDITARHQAEEALANVSIELEKRVDERTAELVAANKLMKKMVDEGKRTEEKLTKSRERLRNLSVRLQSLLEEERTRISREIHDELGQSLTALKLDLSLIRRSLVSDGHAGHSANVLAIERTANRIIRTVRRIATELRPGILDELGVAAAIEWMAKDFRNRTGINCKVILQRADNITNTVRDTAIFRIVQEALTNVMRHAAATQVSVTLKRKGDAVIVEVRDNGIGIVEGRIVDSKSLGLIGIRERVRLLEGEVEISGKPGEGTLVKVTLPTGDEASSNA